MQKFARMLTGQPESLKRKGKYTFGRDLGAGSYGVVRAARNMETGEDVAVKIVLKKRLRGHEEMIHDELKLLRQLNHPHIVSFRDCFESKDKYYIVMQLATGGELFSRICDYGKFTEKDALDTMLDVFDAVKYLHDRNIVHRDLKPENLLYLTPSPDSDLVLADFGIAAVLKNDKDTVTSPAGSLGYAAPEVFLGTGHGKPCDVWSLGVITYTLLSGYSPFQSETAPEFLKEVEYDNFLIFHKQYWSDVSAEAKLFIRKCLQVDPSKRPTIDEMLQDVWVTGKVANTTSDLLPNIRAGFNAKKRLIKAIEAVKLANRIKSLQIDDEDGDSDDESFVPIGETADSLTVPGSAGSSRSRSGSMERRKFTEGKGLAAFQEVVRAATRNKEHLKEEEN